MISLSGQVLPYVQIDGGLPPTSPSTSLWTENLFTSIINSITLLVEGPLGFLYNSRPPKENHGELLGQL